MNNAKKCMGCGIVLQDKNILLEGYTTSLENDICSRCFKMKNYGQYQVVTKSNEEYIKILKDVNKTKDLVLYIIDLLNIDKDLNNIRKYINNKMILVLNKRDVLPKSIKDEKLINYFKEMNYNFEDIVVISTNRNYNIDLLLSKVKKYKTSKNVYVVGNTNVGKSTLINKLIKNYSDNKSDLTISPLPSTTLNMISIKLNEDLTLIDTPGLVDRGNIVNYIDIDMLKKINPKKEIKPKTYQIKANQSIIIEDLVRIDYKDNSKNSLTLYMSNDLKVKRLNSSKHYELKDLCKKELEVGYLEDLVITGIGFIRVIEKANIDVYVNKETDVYTRRSII